MPATGVKDVPANDFVAAYAKHMRSTGKIETPAWADLVKGGVAKELAPYDPDWYFVRAASMARRLYVKGTIGVGAFRKIYGSKKRRGSKPGHYHTASGSIARHILQELEKARVVEKDPSGGRRLTADGRRDLDRIAGRVPPSTWLPIPLAAQ